MERASAESYVIGRKRKVTTFRKVIGSTGYQFRFRFQSISPGFQPSEVHNSDSPTQGKTLPHNSKSGTIGIGNTDGLAGGLPAKIFGSTGTAGGKNPGKNTAGIAFGMAHPQGRQILQEDAAPTKGFQPIFRTGFQASSQDWCTLR